MLSEIELPTGQNTIIFMIKICGTHIQQMSVLLAFEKLRKEGDQEFEDKMDYTVKTFS